MIEIIAKLQYEAIHFWPNADSVPEVSFLKYPHRHVFHIEVRKKVQDDDREIEIIQFKHEIEDYLDEKYNHDFAQKSCEQIAFEILKVFGCSSVFVLEDGENGAVASDFD